MLLAFDSKTGNVKRFVDKLGLKSIQIEDGLSIDIPFVLITYTTDFGSVPMTTIKFLEKNHRNLVGVASSGNRNWGNSYGLAADKISNMYNIPLLYKFELSGTPLDVQKFRDIINNISV
jgi:protein involved in ribonucleotide reduction